MNGFKLVTKYVLISLLCAITLVCLYFVFCAKILKQNYPTLFGMSSAIVQTGSMNPTIKEHDVIVTVKRSNYHIGDVITFKDGSSTTTHRIVGITESGYITKGDANNSADPMPVSKKNVYGKVVLHSSFIGSVVMFLKSPMGIVTILFFLGATISVVVLIDRIKHKALNHPSDTSFTEM